MFGFFFFKRNTPWGRWITHRALSSNSCYPHWFMWCEPGCREWNSSFQSYLCVSSPLMRPLAGFWPLGATADVGYVALHTQTSIFHLFPNVLSINTAVKGIQLEGKWCFLEFNHWVGLQHRGFSMKPVSTLGRALKASQFLMAVGNRSFNWSWWLTK